MWLMVLVVLVAFSLVLIDGNDTVFHHSCYDEMVVFMVLVLASWCCSFALLMYGGAPLYFSCLFFSVGDT
jgi:hypothetical protein